MTELQPADRILRNQRAVLDTVSRLRADGRSIVLTSGSFDVVHIGHIRYLERAKAFGDVLLVGLDSDEKIRQRKGSDRPFFNEDDRAKLLCRFREVDYVCIKPADDPPHTLIKLVEPDVLVLAPDTYDAMTRFNLAAYAGSVVVLGPTADRSTTARIAAVTADPTIMNDPSNFGPAD